MTDDRQGQDERISEIRALHFENADDPDVCYECGREWPCDEAYVVARLDALTAERAAIQAAWNRDRSLLDVAIDHHMSRWKQAEAERDDALARLAAAEAALERQCMISDSMAAWLDDGDTTCDAGNPDGGSALTCNHCIVSGMLAEARAAGRQAEAALAGSREQAAGEGEQQ